jgi:excinuclease UvrABC nuclease subunit
MDYKIKFLSVFDLDGLQNARGVYIFYGDDLDVLYIGTTKNMRTRIFSHLRQNTNSRTYCHLFAFVELFYDLNIIHEEEFIRELKPLFNEHQIMPYVSTSISNSIRSKRKELLSKNSNREKVILNRKGIHLRNNWCKQ